MSKDKYMFANEKILESWLRDTDEGRALVIRAMRPKALVVIDSGGWADVYASDEVEVMVVNCPRSIPAGVELTKSHDESVYTWLYRLLPPRFQVIFKPIYKVATGFWSLFDLQEAIRRHEDDIRAAKELRK